jgi:hypothetical protein
MQKKKESKLKAKTRHKIGESQNMGGTKLEMSKRAAQNTARVPAQHGISGQSIFFLIFIFTISAQLIKQTVL